MNKSKLSNPVRLIAFFLTAVILTFTFGFTVDGWQIGNDTPIYSEQIPPSSTTQETEEKDENEEATNPSDESKDDEEIIIPKYYNWLTGLECSEEISLKAPLAFVMNSSLPIYGLSSAEVVCEIPTEDGGTRLCLFISDTTNLWKIGSITKTRGYISNLSKFFGGICISAGSDDSITYSSCDVSDMYINLFNGNYQYTEFTDNVYTNKELLDTAIKASGVNRLINSAHILPYDFVEINDSEIIYLDTHATRIAITQSSKSVTEFKLNNETGNYLLYHNGLIKTDAITNKSVEYKNCFVLFADSVTYDNFECSQMIMDTLGSGRGFYFTNGTVCEINWVSSSDGSLSFYQPDGQKLIINRGRSYISFMKSSRMDNLFYE